MFCLCVSVQHVIHMFVFSSGYDFDFVCSCGWSGNLFVDRKTLLFNIYEILFHDMILFSTVSWPCWSSVGHYWLDKHLMWFINRDCRAVWLVTIGKCLVPDITERRDCQRDHHRQANTVDPIIYRQVQWHLLLPAVIPSGSSGRPSPCHVLCVFRR